MGKRNDMQNKKKEKNIMENLRNMDRSNMYKILSIVLLVILIITLGSCGLTMYSRNLAYQAYEDLASQVNSGSDLGTDENPIIGESELVTEASSELLEVEATEAVEEVSQEEGEGSENEGLTEEDLIKQLGIEVPKKNLDWKKLHAVNPDIYAWIYIPNTEVEYPIVQHPSKDEYYLNRNLDGSFGKPGCIFTQHYNHKDFLDLNTVVYGHNMKSGRMFRTIHQFEDKKFFEENPYIYVYTEDRVLIYEVFAAYLSDDSHILNTNDLTTTEGYAQYLEKVYRESKSGNVRDDITVTAMNRILTLSTCAKRSNQRFLVQGVLLNDPLLYGVLDD